MEAHTMTHDDGDLSHLLASLTAAEAQEQEPAEPGRSAETVAISNVKPKRTQAEEDELEMALLAELDTITTSADAEPAETGKIDDEMLSELESTVARVEAYANQTSEAEVADPTTAAAAPKQRRQRQASSTPAAARKPRVSLADLSNGVFQLFDGDTIDDTAKAVTLSKRPKQVKIADKFDNLFQSIAAGKAPSRYVVTAMKLLNKNGSMTSADLNAAYVAEGLGKGTASSQTGQVIALFASVGIANRSGQALTARADSVVAKKLMAIIA